MEATQASNSKNSADSSNFSSHIQLILSALSSRFGDEINEAFETMPATEERAAEDDVLKADPDAALTKLQILQQNKHAISEDMRILHQAKVLGSTAQFQGFLHLGKYDYLEASSAFLDEDNDSVCSSDSYSDADPDDSSNSDETSESGSEFDDSDYDSDDSDDSSLGSDIGDLMWEMEQEMGVVIPEDLKVKAVKSTGKMSVVRGVLYRDEVEASVVSMDSVGYY
jgi:hypothetical protein